MIYAGIICTVGAIVSMHLQRYGGAEACMWLVLIFLSVWAFEEIKDGQK